MRRAAKIDIAQPAIVSHLLQGGWSVCLGNAIGNGAPDAFVSRLGHTAALEIKTGNKQPNKRQCEFRDAWQGAYFVVRSPDDAERQLTLWLLTLAKWK